MTVLGTQGIWATAVFRFGQWVYGDAPSAVRVPLKVGYKLAAKVVEVTTGISVPASARIGPGFYIGHFGAIIVHPDTVMGEGCSIGQGVTIGTAGRGKDRTPVIGNRVYLGAGSKVLGGINLGDDVAVGANAVVTRDLPSGVTAVGVPAKIVRGPGAEVIEMSQARPKG
ncbi:MAG: serine acetyltransferase [Deltaproteobacteria bacterium]|nr:serine acetyltransferase [Deltaproteobacteria bacterium]